ncbi:FecCD family ABC transporter permease [Macrococcus capreoli]|uniref:FecCD family ABC transporter permease n=1 Tax=Macrococcus capreoli TaxID=2982690 RepID=UPI0021D5C7A4|nr:iron ABC transporter permease [Macrococcus sp. TMW 2.2395]MCU7558550.1 iron ABC transporter permease [Macrococcus sp. TMW 2.2395]
MQNNYIKLLLLTIILAISMLCSLMFGYKVFSIVDVFQSVFQHRQIEGQNILVDLRIPRTILATLIGLMLGISGVLIQTVTRNPFASPGVMGVNSGASLLVVCAIVLFNLNGTFQLSIIAFSGALLVAAMIIAATTLPLRPLTIMELTLFGASMSAFCMAITQGLLIYNEAAIEQVIYWLSGSVSNKKLSILNYLWPFILCAIVLTVCNIKQLNAYHLDDTALKAVGGNILLIKIVTMICVALLSGASVAIAGPIAFIGLITPHITKMVIKSHNHMLLLPAAAVIGAIIFVISDILSRYLLFPQEIPVGIATALIGSPIFFYLILKRKEHIS